MAKYLSFMVWDECGCEWSEHVVRGVDINSSPKAIAVASDPNFSQEEIEGKLRLLERIEAGDEIDEDWDVDVGWSEVRSDSVVGELRIIDLRDDRDHQAIILIRKEEQQDQQDLEFLFNAAHSCERVHPYDVKVGDKITLNQFSGEGLVVTEIVTYGSNPNLQARGWNVFYEFKGPGDRYIAARFLDKVYRYKS